jgi:hypothetical protein
MKDTIFTIVGDHPHEGEKCKPVIELDHWVTKKFGNTVMFKVELIDCKHGNTKDCFVGKENIKQIKAEKEPTEIAPVEPESEAEAGDDDNQG